MLREKSDLLCSILSFLIDGDSQDVHSCFRVNSSWYKCMHACFFSLERCVIHGPKTGVCFPLHEALYNPQIRFWEDILFLDKRFKLKVLLGILRKFSFRLLQRLQNTTFFYRKQLYKQLSTVAVSTLPSFFQNPSQSRFWVRVTEYDHDTDTDTFFD